jgi:sigma-B regulation protein RsbU (phosphoserine phosphatase)
MFERLLQEETIPIGPGDLFVLFTDGVSEAMNPTDECFGEGRLGELVEEHGHMSSEELRERILREIRAFVGTASQHDDMTMILLKVEEAGAGTVHA